MKSENESLWCKKKSIKWFDEATILEYPRDSVYSNWVKQAMMKEMSQLHLIKNIYFLHHNVQQGVFKLQTIWLRFCWNASSCILYSSVRIIVELTENRLVYYEPNRFRNCTVGRLIRVLYCTLVYLISWFLNYCLSFVELFILPSIVSISCSAIQRSAVWCPVRVDVIRS